MPYMALMEATGEFRFLKSITTSTGEILKEILALRFDPTSSANPSAEYIFMIVQHATTDSGNMIILCLRTDTATFVGSV